MAISRSASFSNSTGVNRPEAGLVWAPPQLARSVVEAVIGTHADRHTGTTATVLPAGSVLFWRDAHFR
ncbi:hypothetical protein [Gordonia aurantiaca]|uniref:hypothetical protein n=1 Tax=Gordonia sp. B21 TaxID=3151852 RepID=UPI0032635A6B